MTDAAPRVSVALCTYNGARFLREQLDSIAAQTLPPIELIACDDASTDATVAILESFSASASFPVRITQNDRTIGVTPNFAQAIAQTFGDYIALADQDDVWLPDKLQRLSTALASRPDAAFAFSDARLIDHQGGDLGGKSLLARRFTLDSIRRAFDEHRELDLMLKRDFIYGTTLLFRAECRDLTLPIPASWSHDTWIANILTLLGHRGVPVLDPLVRYRQHAVQASGGTALPKEVGYPARVQAYEDLRERLVTTATIHPDAIARIDDKLRYLRAMVEVQSSSLPERARIAAAEVASGRWMRYTPRTFTVDKGLDPSSLFARFRQ